jgi:hypothetical protein
MAAQIARGVNLQPGKVGRQVQADTRMRATSKDMMRTMLGLDRGPVAFAREGNQDPAAAALWEARTDL